MAVLAAGRAAFFLMATFALLVEGVLGGGGFRLGAVATGALASFYALMMAAFAISDLALMSSVVESDFAHFIGEFDFGRTIVGGDDHGADGEERNGDQQSDKTFHTDEPPEKGFGKCESTCEVFAYYRIAMFFH